MQKELPYGGFENYLNYLFLNGLVMYVYKCIKICFYINLNIFFEVSDVKNYKWPIYKCLCT